MLGAGRRMGACPRDERSHVQWMDERLPHDWRLDRPGAPSTEPIADLRLAADAALARPQSALPLNQMCGEGSRVTIVCADPAFDLDCPDRTLVPAVLDALKSAGVNDEDITLLAASSARRASTPDEKRRKLGEEVTRRFGVVDHDAANLSELDDLGACDGVPVQVNYRAVEADLLVATGAVRPHPYAGYTGGSQAVAVGCAGAATLRDLHGPRFLDDPTVGAGEIRDNAFQRTIREIARRAGLRFVLNVVVNPDGRAAAIAAGAPNAVHDRLVAFARGIYEVDVPRESYHVVVAGMPAGKDRDLYRASCESAYVTTPREPVLARGGVMILPIDGAAAGGGHGGGHGGEDQRRFYEALSDAASLDAVMHHLRQRGVQEGEPCAYRLAQGVVNRDYRVIVAGPGSVRAVGNSGLIAARDLAEAAALAEAFVGSRPHTLIVPEGRWLMPTFKGARGWETRDAGAQAGPQGIWENALESEMDAELESLLPARGSYTES
jgi:hypothetical protein